MFRLSYENGGLKPGTTDVVRGFLVIETTVGTVKQIATKGRYMSGNQLVTVSVPEGADPDKVDHRIERQIFEKVPGHHSFVVTRQDVTSRPPATDR